MRTLLKHTLFNQKASTGFSTTPVNVSAYQNVILAVVGANTSALTMKLQGGIGLNDIVPDFSAAQGESNLWDYVRLIDMESGTALAGDTGSVLAANDVKFYKVDTSLIEWLSAHVSAFTSGRVSAYIIATGVEAFA